jgi:hypothetical protein
MDGGAPAKPNVPADLSAPGLIYRLRQRGWVLSWSPRSDLVARGYQAKTSRLWPGTNVPPAQSEPTRAEWEVISAWCVRYHAEQLLWVRGGVEDDPKSLFDGTIGSLIDIYERHKKSPYKKLRHGTAIEYAPRLAALKASIGGVRVKRITFDDITNWQEQFADDGDGSAPKKARSSKLIGLLKDAVVFASLVLPKDAGCHDVCDIFSKMREAHLMENSYRQREEYMTPAQCRQLRIKAHEKGRPSVALQQAIAFELGVRQKDVIGEWIPLKYPGFSDFVCGAKKWLMGMRWDEIDKNLILTHRLSKSVRGAAAVQDPKAGKIKAWDLRAYPMIMEELHRVAGKDEFTRADLPASGPLIVCESTGRPWMRVRFARMWRIIATAAGIPANIQNRDSRPGAATEADLAGVAPDKRQRMLGHARGETTRIYEREEVEISREVARLRTEKRKP